MKSDPHRVLTSDDAPPSTFHDCHVRGLRWDRQRFTLTIDMDYIVEWLSPRAPTQSYAFRVSRASLEFENAHEPRIAMDFEGGDLTAQIASLAVVASRPTPNGNTESRYELTFAEPGGAIALWATGYRVTLWTEPRESRVPSLD